MNRDELKEVICRIIDQLQDEEAPTPGCIFHDAPEPGPGNCDMTTYYAVGEEG